MIRITWDRGDGGNRTRNRLNSLKYLENFDVFQKGADPGNTVRGRDPPHPRASPGATQVVPLQGTRLFFSGAEPRLPP